MPESWTTFVSLHSPKLLAFLCGCVIWFGVVSRDEARTDVELPLRLLNLQDNMALVYPLPSQVSVQLEGRAIDLMHLKASNTTRLELDLKDMPLGFSRIDGNQLNFVAPAFPGVKLLRLRQIAPINMELDAKISQKVAVFSNVNLSAAPGFTFLGASSVSPDSVFISGARNVVANVKSIQTKNENFTDLKWNNAISVPLDLSSLPSIVDVSDSSVFVKFQVEPLDHKIFSNVPIRLIGSFDREIYSLSPSGADVEVSGGKDFLSKLSESDINLYIEFSRFSIEDSDELEPTVRIHGAVASWQILPNKFRLQAKYRETAD
ncbi:hypothetical protein AGMMS49938_10050 [Fibrobacterales bacterium]|nr:hypothetical protein AGMMS49938_10050 [Fibrobacterales bacterium]